MLSISSYATGAAGGIFAPLLALGALIGLGVGQLAHQLAPAAVPEPAVFAVVGMAAYFTAIVRAPLTGIVLIVEMTGNYEQMLPLLVTCFCAYAVAEGLKDIPIYEALLERDLSRAGDAGAAEGTDRHRLRGGARLAVCRAGSAVSWAARRMRARSRSGKWTRVRADCFYTASSRICVSRPSSHRTHPMRWRSCGAAARPRRRSGSDRPRAERGSGCKIVSDSEPGYWLGIRERQERM